MLLRGRHALSVQDSDLVGRARDKDTSECLVRQDLFELLGLSHGQGDAEPAEEVWSELSSFTEPRLIALVSDRLLRASAGRADKSDENASSLSPSITRRKEVDDAHVEGERSR